MRSNSRVWWIVGILLIILLVCILFSQFIDINV